MTIIRYAILAVFGLATASSVAAQGVNVLFGRTTDPSIIKTQLRRGLASLEQGVQLLQAASGQGEAAKALDTLYDAYRYLRAAQESSELLNSRKKFPDPTVSMRDKRVLQVRNHLINCRSRFTSDEEGIAMCTREATAALRELRITLEVFP